MDVTCVHLVKFLSNHIPVQEWTWFCRILSDHCTCQYNWFRCKDFVFTLLKWWLMVSDRLKMLLKMQIYGTMERLQSHLKPLKCSWVHACWMIQSTTTLPGWVHSVFEAQSHKVSVRLTYSKQKSSSIVLIADFVHHLSCNTQKTKKYYTCITWVVVFSLVIWSILTSVQRKQQNPSTLLFSCWSIWHSMLAAFFQCLWEALQLVLN